MIDLTLLRNNPEATIATIKRKEPGYDADLLYELDQEVKKLSLSIDELRSQKNSLTELAKDGVTADIREQSIAIGKQIKEKEARLEGLKEKFLEYYLHCPNLIEQAVPNGGKESNQVIKKFDAKPSYSFEVKNHLALGIALGWFDFEAGARMAGSQFALYKNDAVRLLYALTMFMLKHNQTYGYQLCLPPYLVNEESLTVASNLPKFKDQVYALKDDKLFLTPTAEVNLANMYRDHIFSYEELPIRMTSWTSCFRREAGGYGAAERGLIRMHQFEKVELYTITTPGKSFDEHERMLECAEQILQKLNLHYRVSLLAAQDCSFASAKTYDIEAWLPGQKEYYEVSSVSNCTDFQARRGCMRYSEKGESKTHLVHTLNGSSLALSRLMVAIMETYQNSDGSVEIPEILKKEALF